MSDEPYDATPSLPARLTLRALRDAAEGCRGCPLWRPATQTVFGEGRKRSRLMLVGEIPGDREDRAGRPFVGPAGRELEGLEVVGPDLALEADVGDPEVVQDVQRDRVEAHRPACRQTSSSRVQRPSG